MDCWTIRTTRIRAFIDSGTCSNARAFATAVEVAQPRIQSGAHKRALTKAQREWIHLDEIREGLHPEPDPVAPPRYDWRERAFSRVAGKLKESRPVYVSRKIPEYAGRNQFVQQIKAYRDRFIPLIKAEQEVEEKVVLDRLRDWGLEKLKKEGYCLTGLHAFFLEKTSLGRRVAGFRMSNTLPHNVFGLGTQVYISRIDPLKENWLKGSVVDIFPEQINIAFEEEFDGINEGFWRLDLGASVAIYERMREAIYLLNSDPEVNERDPLNKRGERELILQGTQLRDVLLESFTSATNHDASTSHKHLQDPAERHYLNHEQLDHENRLGHNGEISRSGGAFNDNCLIRSWAQRYQKPEPVVIEGDPVLSGLNASQVRAMAMMIGERISLVQGPPGTGKTKTIVETAKLLKGHFEVPHPLLVCTYTNVAVDNLLESLVDGGLKPLRVGFEGKVKGGLESYMLEHQFERHMEKPRYDTIMEERKEVAAEIHGLLTEIRATKKKRNVRARIENMEVKLKKLEDKKDKLSMRAYVVKQKIIRDIVMRSDVICTTCVRSASYTLKVTDFPVVFLDEASMSTEPASLVALMKGCKHLALIGDHKQLPPVVVSPEARDGGLSISLFERLTSEGAVPSVMLDTQYRMHPKISEFPSSEFYDLMLLDGTVHAGEIAPELLPPSSAHLVANPTTGHRPSVIFIDHQGPEAMKSKSRVNWTEGYIVCSIIEDLLRKNEDLLGEDIGVIAPYKSQISLLTRLLTKDISVRDRFNANLSDRASEIANIEVKTVDGFEGREKEAIIFSTVRNNASGYIGFLADRRRLNVGLTRAKRALFIVGNMSTLEKGKFGWSNPTSNLDGGPGQELQNINKGAIAWRNYARYLNEKDLVLKLEGEELAKVLKSYADPFDKRARYSY
ncbi:hypothetical protein M0805_007260 [Coniferiporia weirii]|nr:hypothetical protein M0805_007260 [Coniferiporia weirii]